MPDDDTTSFDLIEQHKENITPISSGRSARALASALSPLALNPTAAKSEHYARRTEFEEELKHASELDDPLDVWLRYIKWTNDTFPSGNSAESGLLNLIERCTRQFVKDTQYANDPRYLKLWIQYAQQFSDAPREVFAYLARNQIGQKLALFYEEYAAMLESQGRRTQAEEMYNMGLNANARPKERLHRKYDEFRHRMEANPPTGSDPSSPALPAVRPALATKCIPGLDIGSSEQAAPPQPTPKPATKPAKQKMAIFSDADAPAAPKASASKSTGGWDNIGSLQHRKKENTMERRPWAGETLKGQKSEKPKGEKLMVFRDTSKAAVNHVRSSNQTLGRRPERLAVNIELLLPEGEDEEFSFEELRAKKMGLYDYDWQKHREEAVALDEDDDEENYEGESMCETPPRSPGLRSRTPIKVKTILSPSPNKGKIKRKGRSIGEPTMTFHTKAATDEIYGLFSGPLANAPSDGSDSSDDDGPSDDDYTTFIQVDPQSDHSGSDSDAQPADDTIGDITEDDNGDSVHSVFSEFAFPVKGDENDENRPVEAAAKGVAKLSIFSDDLGERHSRPEPRRMQIPPPPPPVDFDRPKQHRLPYMTPIVETTEHLPSTIKRDAFGYTPSRSKAAPFTEQILEESPESNDEDYTRERPFSPVGPRAQLDFRPKLQPKLQPKPDETPVRRPLGAKVLAPAPTIKSLVDDTLCNPQDPTLRSTIISKLNPPLKSYEGFYELKWKKFNMSSEIKKFVKATAAKRDGGHPVGSSRAPSLEFVTGDGGSFYTVLRELGKGAFAPVFLVENNMVADAEDEAEDMDGEIIIDSKLAGRRRFEALKMEHPPSPWEFYIIRTARDRLKNHRAKDSIVAAHEMHIFQDEGYLLIDYFDQGTILDIVNANRADPANISGGGLDESLAMFLTIEVLRTVEALHNIGIIHGDLKADNCLVRCEPTPDHTWNPHFRADGSEGWHKKGVSLIDFGRGIDMKLFPPNVQFLADWKTDHQDCAEMRELRPWTWQVDYHGIAAIAYLMLFGEYIKTTTEAAPGVGGRKKYRISGTLKRYWQQELWKELFEVLLNPLQYVDAENKGTMPINKSLKSIRVSMEKWLEANADKGAGLKNLVRKKLEVAAKRK
ncbi:hypothetical protein EX30DRAFT_367053 [Ascodesmis nigricans]|uniref:Uncharacterized protein n=1 Tax=Ascodesmis nigricans TaxID=341454 RepID=A0A4S2MJ60_9PEZI|nr:hypothetical protein EX30DRAFT_367053 [Ascodesmis nigricans]